MVWIKTPKKEKQKDCCICGINVVKCMKMFSGFIYVLSHILMLWFTELSGPPYNCFFLVGLSVFEKHTTCSGVYIWIVWGLKATSLMLADFCPQRKLITEMDQSTAALTWKLTLVLLLYHNSTEHTRLSHHAGAEAKTAVSWCSSLHLRSSCLTLQLRSQWDGPRRLF